MHIRTHLIPTCTHKVSKVDQSFKVTQYFSLFCVWLPFVSQNVGMRPHRNNPREPMRRPLFFRRWIPFVCQHVEMPFSAFGSKHFEWRAPRSSASFHLGTREQSGERQREKKCARPQSLWTWRARTSRILFLTEWLYERLRSAIPQLFPRLPPFFSVYQAAHGIGSPKRVQSHFVSVSRALCVDGHGYPNQVESKTAAKGRAVCTIDARAFRRSNHIFARWTR